MKINKDSKMALTRPSKEKMTHLLQFRSTSINNLKSQIFPEDKKTHNSCYKLTSRDRASGENVKSMLSTLHSHGMFKANKPGLCTLLDHKQATPEQAHDLFNFRVIGQVAFENHVKYKILKQPSTEAPVRKKRLLTFTVKEPQKKRIKLVEIESKLCQRFLKRQLAWMADNNISPATLDTGPISSLPRALVQNNDGLPYKSCKSKTTTFLAKRYKSLLLNSLPWTPTSVLLEGMFMVHTAPYPEMKSMREYAKLLLIRYVRPHYSAGTEEVHVIFDNPGGLKESPKELEQRRRDLTSKPVQHSCMTFDSDAQIPSSWVATIACRNCKAALTTYLAQEFLKIAPQYMLAGTEQEFLTNIKSEVYSCSREEEIIQRPSLYSNTNEGDMRIWLPMCIILVLSSHISCHRSLSSYN